MCEICGRSRCLQGCPNRIVPSAKRCRACGMMLMEGDGYFRVNGKPYCEECMTEAKAEDLVRIFEIEPDELWARLGTRHCVFGSGKE